METKVVHVKAHDRLIKQVRYRFVCKGCNKTVERICYPSQPLYCVECRPPKPASTKPVTNTVAFKNKKRRPIHTQQSRAQ
jgi:hypothetical protein